MRSVAGLVLILLLAACSKQEPPPADSSTNAVKPTSPAPATPAPVASPTNTLPAANKDPESEGPLPAVSAESPSQAAAQTPEGAAIFTATCATCHMADGYGVPYLQPSIKGSAWISNPDPQLLLTLILRGSAILGEASQAYENDMAPQDHLSNAEIAAVASYVRQRFAAVPITEPVTPEQVALARNRPGLP